MKLLFQRIFLLLDLNIRNTYKELKHEPLRSLPNGVCILEIPIRNWNEPTSINRKLVAIILEIPIRNWNSDGIIKEITNVKNIRNTYKELKLFNCKYSALNLSYIRNTYKKLKQCRCVFCST